MIDVSGYGKALFELAQENGTDERVRRELELIRTALRQEPSYITLLDTPAVATEEKLSLVREAFGGVEESLMSFLCILCEKRSVYALSACADAFDRCYDEAHGILRATAVTAVPMSAAQNAALTQRLTAMTGKQIVLTNELEPALLGGITLRYGGVQLDDSIHSRLEQLSRSLRETIV